MLVRGDVSQRSVSRLGTALAQVAGNGGNDGTLHLGIPINFRAGHNVLGMPVVSLVIDELAGVAQNGSGL